MWNTSQDGLGWHIILLEVTDSNNNYDDDSKNVEVGAKEKGGGNPGKGGPKK